MTGNNTTAMNKLRIKPFPAKWQAVVDNGKGIIRKGDVVWMQDASGKQLLCTVDSIKVVPPSKGNFPSTRVDMTEMETGTKHWTEMIERLTPAVRMPEHKCYHPR